MTKEFPFRNYADAIAKHVREVTAELDSIDATKNVTPVQYRATERLLQILVESAIGFTKQWLKSQQETVPNEAYQAFQKLSDAGLVSSEELKVWRKVIGLRNAIVHDYLHLDRQIIHNVLINRWYHDIANFVLKNTDTLRNISNS